MTQERLVTRPAFIWRCQLMLLMLLSLAITWSAGCANHQKRSLDLTSAQCDPCQTMLQQIEYPELIEEDCLDGQELFTPKPITLTEYENQVPWDLTVDECVAMTLANSKVLQKIGGVVVSAPQGATTLYDQALTETNPSQSVEAALAAFDTQFQTSAFLNRNERKLNIPPEIAELFGVFGVTNGGNFDLGFSKTTATGATLGYRNITDYLRQPPTASNRFSSVWNIVHQLELRQPLLQGAGAQVNRIAGPNALPGFYNGVLIARVRSDITLADFEASVRDLVRDVENNYWELYFAYRDLDTQLTAREAARETWENRKLRFENGVGRPDDEAQARQQYLTFQLQAQNSLLGRLQGQLGVVGSERNLRRLMGLPVNDGRLIRPVSDPTLAPVVFDWDGSQSQAITRRVEIRRQKWTVRQRELELLAAKQLNKWRFDFVGQYGFRGFGDNLFGSRSRPEGSAWDDLINGDLDDWQFGFELNGPIGNRTGHLAVRNAQLNLVRERTILKEQQRQILHDLGAAFTEVDRALASMRTSFNSRVAVLEELAPKQKRVIEGQDQVFFLLDALQRAATAESAVHRSIADYNQALLNYAYVSGSLLARYNVSLAEGPWSEDAQENAIEKARRFINRGPNDCNRDHCPVSLGAFDQSQDVPVQPYYEGVINQGAINEPAFMPSEATEGVEESGRDDEVDSILSPESLPPDDQ